MEQSALPYTGDKQGFLGKAAYWVHGLISEWWPESALGLAGLGGTAASAFPGQTLSLGVVDTTVPIVSFCASCGLLLIGGYGVARKSKKVSAIKDEAKRSKYIANQYKLDTREIIQDYLRDLSRDCGLGNDKGACRPDTRISVYCHDDENSRFIPIARISGNPKYESAGRSSYPDSQGVIAAAWETGFTRNAVKVNDETHWEDEWVKTQVNEWHFSEDVARNFSMKSRIFVAWRIEYANQFIGVVVIESTVKSRVGSGLKGKVESSPYFEPLMRALFRINSSHIPHIAGSIKCEEA